MDRFWLDATQGRTAACGPADREGNESCVLPPVPGDDEQSPSN